MIPNSCPHGVLAKLRLKPTRSRQSTGVDSLRAKMNLSHYSQADLVVTTHVAQAFSPNDASLASNCPEYGSMNIGSARTHAA